MKGDKAIKVPEKSTDFLLFSVIRNQDDHILKLAVSKDLLPCPFCCHD